MKKACRAPQRVYPSEAATTHHPNFAKKETLNVLGPPLEIFVFRYPIKEVNRYIERLVDDLIERTINPAFWDVNGGPGTIVYYAPLQCLVVRATAEVHGDVGRVVGDLRKVGP